MRKLAGQLGSEVMEEHRRPRWPLVLVVLILLVGLGPLALEGAAVLVGTWKEFLGVSCNVRTPLLDSLQDNLNDMNAETTRQIHHWFNSMPWDPNMVLPVAAVVMVVAMLMLRRN